MTLFSAFLFAFAGAAALCVAMVKHQAATLGRALKVKEQTRLRWGAGALLAAAYVAASAATGWNVGPVAWTGAIILGGLSLALLLAYRPSLIVWLGVGASVGAVVLILAGELIDLLSKL